MSNIEFESSAVQSYLGNLQSVINRMAANSASSKTWCITLVSAVVVFASDKSKPDSVWMALIPIGLFFLLDAYYLNFEIQFRALYNEFVGKLHLGTAKLEDIYVMTPSMRDKSLWLSTAKAAASFSVWPFYSLVTVMLVILRSWIF